MDEGIRCAPLTSERSIWIDRRAIAVFLGKAIWLPRALSIAVELDAAYRSASESAGSELTCGRKYRAVSRCQRIGVGTSSGMLAGHTNPCESYMCF